jgi:hypothetical protein
MSATRRPRVAVLGEVALALGGAVRVLGASRAPDQHKQSHRAQ